MRRDDHAALCDLTDALFEREAARLRALRDEEARLRMALARLDAQAHDARRLPEDTLRGVREIGADLAWQGWLARHRATLRDALAQVLARKEHAMPAQRRAFGRAEAARALHARSLAEARARQDGQQAALLEGLGVMMRMRRDGGPDQVS
ncbi:hypothetical protein ABIE58_000856 [Roseovarius sp. MBR-78]|jgi:hypothetical protein|uniref:hypothetical protein n=1 Tax=Roseovarius sp. MBR-78 TaxID=3156460 RepID=UPI003393EC69